MKRITRELAPPLAGVAGLIVVWAIVAAFVSPDKVPSPAEVWSAFRRGVSNGSITAAAAKTLLRLGFSFAVSIVIGTAIGFGLALNEFARRAIRPLVVALQITPFIAWLPLAVVWFGLTERAVVFVAVVGAFPSVTLATISSFGQVPPLLKRAGRTLGATGWHLYTDVIFPAALPGYVGGLQQAWGFAWKALTAGELITAGLHATGLGRATGLGQLLQSSKDDVPMLIATVAVIVVIGVAVEYFVFGRVDRTIRRKRGLLVEH